jgi:hypothetical protein
MSMPAPRPDFHYAVRTMTSNLIEIEYAGYMPEDDEHVRVTEQVIRGSPGSVCLYYYVGEFIGYHRSQIQRHAEMLKSLGTKVRGIAVVGARPVVRFGAITVSLISSTPLKTFDSREAALDWLETL